MCSSASDTICSSRSAAADIRTQIRSAGTMEPRYDLQQLVMICSFGNARRYDLQSLITRNLFNQVVEEERPPPEKESKDMANPEGWGDSEEEDLPELRILTQKRQRGDTDKEGSRLPSSYETATTLEGLMQLRDKILDDGYDEWGVGGALARKTERSTFGTPIKDENSETEHGLVDFHVRVCPHTHE